MIDQVPSEVWYTILGWFLATVGTAVLRALYQAYDLWKWERDVLSHVTIFAHDEERGEIRSPIDMQTGRVESFELVLHIASDPQKYKRCMNHITRCFNPSLLSLTHTRKKGDEVYYQKNMEAYVLKPYESVAKYPDGWLGMSRKELIKHAHENRIARTQRTRPCRGLFRRWRGRLWRQARQILCER